MAQRMLSFIYSRAPRATGVSDEAIDEHKELMRDLYLTRNYTRDQVIAHLKTELNFNLSPDQFSKAIRRWGFRKQFHSGRSTQQPPNETASPYTITNTSSNDLSCTTDGEHPTTALDPCPLPYPPEKQPKPRSDLVNIIAQSLWLDIDIDEDGDITMSSPTAEESIEPSLSHQSVRDVLLSAEYLSCRYHYTKAFNCYSTILHSFEGMYSYKERRARMLDMARVATTRRNCELVRLMLETELEMSNDPLDEEGHTRSSPKEADMSRMQSFLFHRHLAQIYARQNDDAIPMQKHLDNARNFTKTFGTHGTESIDIWALLFLVQDRKDSQIPEELLGSLQWDFKSDGLNIEYCVRHCWGELNPTMSLHQALIKYDAGHRTRIESTEMSDLVLQNSSFHLRKRSSILFTFLWKEIQLTHGTLPWESRNPTISPAHILMIVSRIIVKRSCLISKLKDDLPNQTERQVDINPENLRLYCDALLGLFLDNRVAPDETKREFATQFVEHHAWSSLLDSKSALASQSQSYPIEALKSVLATRRDGFIADHQGQTVLPNQRPAESYSQDRQFPPSLYSSGKSSYLTTSPSSNYTHINALKGNPTMTRSLASHSSCSSQRSYSSSLRRFKAAALSRQRQPELTMALSENPDVLMDEDFLENLQEDECQDCVEE